MDESVVVVCEARVATCIAQDPSSSFFCVTSSRQRHVYRQRHRQRHRQGENLSHRTALALHVHLVQEILGLPKHALFHHVLVHLHVRVAVLLIRVC